MSKADHSLCVHVRNILEAGACHFIDTEVQVSDSDRRREEEHFVGVNTSNTENLSTLNGDALWL